MGGGGIGSVRTMYGFASKTFFFNNILDTYEMSFERDNRNDYAKSQSLSPISSLTASLWIQTSDTTASTLFTFGPPSPMVQFVLNSAGAAFCIWMLQFPYCRYFRFK